MAVFHTNGSYDSIRVQSFDLIYDDSVATFSILITVI